MARVKNTWRRNDRCQALSEQRKEQGSDGRWARAIEKRRMKRNSIERSCEPTDVRSASGCLSAEEEGACRWPSRCFASRAARTSHAAVR